MLLACRPLVEELAQQLALASEQLGMQRELLESLQPLELGLQQVDYILEPGQKLVASYQ